MDLEIEDMDNKGDMKHRRKENFPTHFSKKLIKKITTAERNLSKKEKLQLRNSPSKMRITDYEAVHKAYIAVKTSNLSLYAAARLYGCNRNTLARRWTGKVPLGKITKGPQSLLTENAEWELASHISKFSESGYRFTRSEIIDLATDYAVFLGKRSPEEPPLSHKWYFNFRKRNQIVSVRNEKPRSLNVYRAQASKVDNIKHYFDSLRQTLDYNNFLDNPHLIYSIDEKGLVPEYDSPEIAYIRWTNCSDKGIPPKRNLVTLIGCGNAVGCQIPPYFVFPGDHFDRQFIQQGTEGTGGTVSITGWSDWDVFKTYLKDHFLKYVTPTREQPVLLIFDGHKSYISVGLAIWAFENHITLFVLPAHTSDFLHPLEVGCFNSVERSYTNHKQTLLKDSQRTLNNEEVCRLACLAYQDGMDSRKLVDAFKKTGIYPFKGIEAIEESRLTPSDPFKVENKENLPDTEQEINNSLWTSECDLFKCGRCDEQFDDVLSFLKHREEEDKQRSTKQQNKKSICSVSKQKNKIKKAKETVEEIDLTNTSLYDDTKHKLLNVKTEAFNPATECCVCMSIEPPQVHHFVIKLDDVPWIGCDFCDHWAHVGLCVPSPGSVRPPVWTCPCTHN